MKFTKMLLLALFLPVVESKAEEIPPTYFNKPNTQGLKRVEDNSFLLEEAYNQERGVLQFIQTMQWDIRAKTFNYAFANEIPITDEKHQFSYTIPLTLNRADNYSQGLGDISLEYRTQWVKRRDELLMATKFSLVLPTGNKNRGMGTGMVGVRANHAITAIISDSFVTHWNFGAEYYPRSKNPDGGGNSTLSFNYGMSIFYMATDSFNVFTEFYASNDEVVDDVGVGNSVPTSRVHSFIVNPGVRMAIDNDGGSQIVPGISFPYTVGIDGAVNDFGMLLYLSFEDKFW